MSLEIERVETGKQLREFVRFPWTVYKNDPYWVPPLFFERLAFLDKSKNPFFEHAEADYFIARRDGRVAGTIAAILNHRHNEFHDENVTHFGLFEVLDDSEAAALLLNTACRWAEERGADKILGPLNLSTNDECGLLIEGFDSPPVILMTYNPGYYIDFIEAAGFSKAMDLLAWNRDIADLAHNLPEKLLRVVQKVKDRYGLTIRQLNLKDWDSEVDRIETIYNSAWEKNWGFVPMTHAEIRHLASSLKLILDPAIAFAVEKEGKAVGFALSLPDVNVPLLKIRPGPSLIGSYLALLRLLFTKHRTKRLRVFALGVKEEYRARGVDALMYYQTAVNALPRGYEWAEASWILENNDAMNRPIEMLGSVVYKKYRIYEKALKPAAGQG
jgi:GNAT superfamily N-acetyltransferase